MSRALRGFTHPAAARELDWDPRDVGRLRPAPDDGGLGKLLDREQDLDEQAKLRKRIAGIDTAWPVKPYRAMGVAA